MLSRASLLTVCRHAVTKQRQFSITPVTYKAATATDPIQQLFVDKVRLYAQKSKEAGGKLVDATPDVEARYKSEIERVEKQYGAVKGEDFSKFPAFNFQDTELEAVGVSVDVKAEEAAEAADEVEEDDKPYFIV